MSVYKLETPTGSISVTKNVIGRIISEAARKYRGKVYISNHKGSVPGFPHKIKDADLIGSMDISMGENGLDLRIYVVIRFGTSIGLITDTLIEEIYLGIKELLGIEPNSVAIVVTGMIAKEQMSRRNIEVKR